MTKKEQIKKTLLATKTKRKCQVVKVREIKIDKSKLNKNQLTFLNMIFVEAKWLYNHILSLSRKEENKSNKKFIKEFDTKTDKVITLNKDKQEKERELKYISSQMKQSVQTQIMDAIYSLFAKKKKGIKVGRLKFRGAINSINLKQFGSTYKILGNNKIKIQGLKQTIKVYGLDQIDASWEFANAKLIKKNGDFYLKITCYAPKKEKGKYNKNIGIDFGIKNDLVQSDGIKIDIKVPVSKKIRRAHRKLSKKNKRSKNKYKAQFKLNKEYEKQNNIKKEINNKLVSYFINNYDYTFVQDENIKGWHGGLFGKQVQQSAIGGIIRELKKDSHTIVVDRWEATTKTCRVCKKKNDISLDERVYVCECGYNEDRDTHSALSIKEIGEEILHEKLKDINNVPAEYREHLVNESLPRKTEELSSYTIEEVKAKLNCKWITLSQATIHELKPHSFSVR